MIPGVQGGVAAAAGGGLADVAGAPPLLVAAVVGDLEDAALVEVQPASLAFQALQNQCERCRTGSHWLVLLLNLTIKPPKFTRTGQNFGLST